MITRSTQATWVTESSQGMQIAYGIAGILVGGALVFGSRIQNLEPVTSAAVLVLGVLICLTSSVMLFVGGKQVISVDPRRRIIEVRTHSRLGNKVRTILFSQVTEISLAELGDSEGGSISYHVALRLKDGGEVALFLGAFEGRYDRQAMDARRSRLNDYLQVPLARA